MEVEFDHSQNTHSLEGARAGLSALFGPAKPASLLDVGCGVGAWLKAAVELGVADVFGVDGVNISKDEMMVAGAPFRQQDLTTRWDLGRRFDVVMCLEVGEHLDEEFAPLLVETLTRHGDTVIFSAACPGQGGQHHVNCQWPEYWQRIFNSQGFICDDSVRWQIWRDTRIEPWYRQNIFVARRASQGAGKEPRIAAVMHPEILTYLTRRLDFAETSVDKMSRGWMGIRWHLDTLGKALKRKLPSFLGGEAKPPSAANRQPVVKNAPLQPETGIKTS